MNPHERFAKYKGKKCWQGHIKDVNRNDDLATAGLTQKQADALRTSDFDFAFIRKTDKQGCAEIKAFIERHEWLGKMPIFPTHRFVARLKSNGQIACVVVMATPNAFQNLLGMENKNLEKLIARGASISWAPKNIGSWMIMQSIRWMVKNTDFRIFTAYSDPEAKELGTIYQACGFSYLGQSSGATKQWQDPLHPEKGWFSDRMLTMRSVYVRMAKDMGIEFLPEWRTPKGKVNWKNVPDEIEKKIRDAARAYRDTCISRICPPKHKYAMIMGPSKGQTKYLRRLFAETKPELVNLPYPTQRGK